MKGYTKVCGEATLQGDRASVIVEIAQDVSAIGDILHDMAASSEEGTTRNAEMEPPSKEALGEESYTNLYALAKAKGIDLKDLADSIGLTPKRLREGVMDGSRFPRKAGAFDAMCRQLGFEPSEARRYLGGIYEAEARDERFEARMSINGKLQKMHAVYQKIVDPSKRYAAEAAIDGLWDFLNKLADSQG